MMNTLLTNVMRNKFSFHEVKSTQQDKYWNINQQIKINNSLTTTIIQYWKNRNEWELTFVQDHFQRVNRFEVVP